MAFWEKLFGKNDISESKTDISDLKSKLMSLARNEIRLTYSKSSTPLSACDSKIGGKPAVPLDFVWPQYTGKDYLDEEEATRPLSFMAQINLKDIADYDKENLLPKTGIISFFYEQITMKWGFESEDKGSARVFYFPETENLKVMDFPENLDDEVKLPEFSVNFEQHISLPNYTSFPDKLDCEWEEYDEVCEECGYESDGMGDVTKLLGYPDVIQNPMENECERVTRGYRCGSPEDSKEISDDEMVDINEKSKDWTMLFQMGTIYSDENSWELMFGDCGHIYFWIKKEDLANLDFSNVWLILQCG